MANSAVAMSRTAGKALQDVPLRSMFTSLARGIADTQARLDEAAVRMIRQMADATTTLHDPEGNLVTRSLLELGFVPSFYHFSEARIEVKVTLTMRTEEAEKTAAGMTLSSELGTSSSETTTTTEPASGESPAA